MGKPVLYERVALARDLDQHGLKKGDVATIVDTVPHPDGGAEGLVLEVTNAIGESLQVVVVTPADVEPLSANEVLAVRHLVRRREVCAADGPQSVADRRIVNQNH